MRITTSKHADKKMGATAKQLAAALPDAAYFSRGERSLERLEELAVRAGDEELLVVSAPQTERDGKKKGKKTKKTKTRTRPLVLIRRRERQKNGQWIWNENEMAVQKLEMAPLASARQADSSADPITIKADGADAQKWAEFLGLQDDARAEMYDEHRVLSVKTSSAKTAGATATLTLEKKKLLTINYRWNDLCPKK